MWIRGATLLSVLLITAGLATGVAAGGCGAGIPEGDGGEALFVSTTSAGPGRTMESVFVDLAAALAPMPVYAPTVTGPDTRVADEWWPVIELTDPGQYQGPARTNPRIVGRPEGEPEVQIVFDCEGGWLVVVENFRGDLGDVRGERVGMVEGRDAYLYEVGGGLLVQWSSGGRWYGVFGREVPADLVVDLALSMRVVSADAAD